MEVREVVTKALEDARAEKLVNKSQEAAVRVTAPAEALESLKQFDAAVFEELFIVSGVELIAGDEFACEVLPAAGEKCPRCWNYRELGGNANHPAVCKRCGDALDAIGFAEGSLGGVGMGGGGVLGGGGGEFKGFWERGGAGALGNGKGGGDISTLGFRVLLLVFAPHRRTQRARLQMAGYALVLAGGIGNAIDRFVQGYVTDFIEFSFIDFPVFNVADIGVTCGFALIVICYFLSATSKTARKGDGNGPLGASRHHAADDEGMRLDAASRRRLLPARSAAAKHIEAARCFVNGNRPKKRTLSKPGIPSSTKHVEDEIVALLRAGDPFRSTSATRTTSSSSSRSSSALSATQPDEPCRPDARQRAHHMYGHQNLCACKAKTAPESSIASTATRAA